MADDNLKLPPDIFETDDPDRVAVPTLDVKAPWRIKSALMADTATTATMAGDADTVDGAHASDLALNIPGYDACTDPDVDNDALVIYDASAATHKKVKPIQIQPTSVNYATKAGDGNASSNIRIPTSQPTSLANGDIWLV